MHPSAYLDMADTESRHWWFLARRMILTSVIDRLPLPPAARILEIGCGTGGNLNMLSAFGRVSALEMDATARSIASKKTLDQFDIRAGTCPADIPFHTEKFDLICLFDVLEHVKEDSMTLVAIRNLLSDAGKIVITVPAHQWLWSRHDEFLHHKRRYSAQELREKFVMAGLRVEKLSFFNTLLFPLAVAARLKDRFLGATHASGTRVPEDPFNSLLYHIFSLERHLLARLSLPFGISLLAILSNQESP